MLPWGPTTATKRPWELSLDSIANATTAEERFKYFTDPWLLAPWVLVACTVALTGKRVQLSMWEERRANWYLFNGAVINPGLDGIVGVMGKLPLLRKPYTLMDGRYRDGESVVCAIGLMELTIYPVTCILLYRAYWLNASYRRPLEIVVCVGQFYGTVMFVVTEWWNGNPFIVVDRNLEFTVDHFMFFWVGYCLNYVWFAIPFYLGWKAFWETVEMIEQSSTVTSAAATTKKVK